MSFAAVYFQEDAWERNVNNSRAVRSFPLRSGDNGTHRLCWTDVSNYVDSASRRNFVSNLRDGTQREVEVCDFAASASFLFSLSLSLSLFLPAQETCTSKRRLRWRTPARMSSRDIEIKSRNRIEKTWTRNERERGWAGQRERGKRETKILKRTWSCTVDLQILATLAGGAG